MRNLIVPAMALMLAACGDGADRTPGGVSADEAAALNDAAAMLDVNSVSEAAIDADATEPSE